MILDRCGKNTCKVVCLDRRIEHIDLRWFDFPLLRRAILPGALQDGEGRLESFLRFPDGDAHERSFFRILKRIRSLENNPRLLLHQLAKFVHTLNQQPFLFRLRIMDGIEDKHGSTASSRVSGSTACTPSPTSCSRYYSYSATSQEKRKEGEVFYSIINPMCKVF